MKKTITVSELFAGVGGFRLGLEAINNKKGIFQTVWANQWEPPGSDAKQFAWRCYETRFGKGSCVNKDIHEVLKSVKNGTSTIPQADLLVGGFPCQDYSVAKPLSMSQGMEGKKGVLWWDIYAYLENLKPSYVLLENVDRLLKSPASQRGRDFAVMLSCFSRLGYSVEWRVINSGEFGFPQRRKRVFIFAALHTFSPEKPNEPLLDNGVLSGAFPARELIDYETGTVSRDAYKVSCDFGKGLNVSPFKNAGYFSDGKFFTANYEVRWEGEQKTLQDILVSPHEVPENYWLNAHELSKWQYLKGAKREERFNKKAGFKYIYSEGSMSFPDKLTAPSRTILTGEGGAGASRFEHVVKQNGRLRRLLPVELERLQTFPDNWTNTGMTDTQRAFCMGNALVVGVVSRIGEEILNRAVREKQKPGILNRHKRVVS